MADRADGVRRMGPMRRIFATPSALPAPSALHHQPHQPAQPDQPDLHWCPPRISSPSSFSRATRSARDARTARCSRGARSSRSSRGARNSRRSRGARNSRRSRGASTARKSRTSRSSRRPRWSAPPRSLGMARHAPGLFGLFDLDAGMASTALLGGAHRSPVRVSEAPRGPGTGPAVRSCSRAGDRRAPRREGARSRAGTSWE